MNEQLVSKKTSTLAKEKGFNEETYDYFNQNGECETSLKKEYFNKGIHTSENIITISCPTQSLLQKWLREKHNLYICISAEFYKTGINHTLQILCYNPNLSESDYYDNDKCTGMYGDNAEFETYEDALEFGLQKALTFVQ